jgi:hypothetical protein
MNKCIPESKCLTDFAVFFAPIIEIIFNVSQKIFKWHILKNILPIFVKIYFDAGLKELALKFHRGATLKVLTDCTKFQITNRFFIHAWEALFRYQIQTFMLMSPKRFSNDLFLSKIFSHNLESRMSSVLSSK